MGCEGMGGVGRGGRLSKVVWNWVGFDGDWGGPDGLEIKIIGFISST